MDTIDVMLRQPSNRLVLDFDDARPDQLSVTDDSDGNTYKQLRGAFIRKQREVLGDF